MSNSSLVSYTKYSPNHSGQRTHAIDRITPHCVVGQVTVERLGDIFAPESKQASSNYGVGLDGRIGLYVDECNRSWCTGGNLNVNGKTGSMNDQRAVTIEVASDNTAPYAFTDAAYNGLIDLSVDICKRNGKSKLVWISDKFAAEAYEPKADEMLVTVHRWYASKSCPGDWFMSKIDDYVAQVNNKLGGVPVMDNEKTIWDSLKAWIGNDFGVAGLMGNLQAESGLRSNNLQNSYEKSLGMTDEVYTQRVDSDAYKNFVLDKAGYGLAQWTFYTRKQNLYNYAKSTGKSIGDLGMQLEFLKNEITTGYKATFEILKNAKSVKEASDAVLTQFEKPANQGDEVKAKRAEYGTGFYNKYHGATPTPAPTGKMYYVQVGAFSVKANAEAMLARAKAAGFKDAFIKEM